MVEPRGIYQIEVARRLFATLPVAPNQIELEELAQVASKLPADAVRAHELGQRGFVGHAVRTQGGGAISGDGMVRRDERRTDGAQRFADRAGPVPSRAAKSCFAKNRKIE